MEDINSSFDCSSISEVALGRTAHLPLPPTHGWLWILSRENHVWRNKQIIPVPFSTVKHPSLFSHALYHTLKVHIIMLNFKANFEAQNNPPPYCTPPDLKSMLGIAIGSLRLRDSFQNWDFCGLNRLVHILWSASLLEAKDNGGRRIGSGIRDLDLRPDLYSY